MIDRLAVAGGTGDLSARYLLPGLAALYAAGHLPDGFELVCADRSDWDTERFRSWAAAQLDRYGGALPDDARKAVVASARFRQTDITDAAAVRALVGGATRPPSSPPTGC
jgi:glucose-6-phosphate 1-dehydrogenase